MTDKAEAKEAEVQEPQKILSQPDGAQMETTRTLELLLPKWPKKAQRAFRTPKVTNNLVAVCELCDAGCGVYFHRTGVEEDYDGEIISRGWRDRFNRLWRIPITLEGGERIVSTTDTKEVVPRESIIFSAEVNVIYECKNTEQLTQYFHASLGSHTRRLLLAAAEAGYLRGCPSFMTAAIRKYIGVEVATECGHMKQIQQDTRSTTMKSKRGRPKKPQQRRVNHSGSRRFGEHVDTRAQQSQNSIRLYEDNRERGPIGE